MSDAQKITMDNGQLHVPEQPIIPFIEGDGIGPDIWKASVHVFDSAVEKAYGSSKSIEWLEVLAGEKAFNATAEWLPQKPWIPLEITWLQLKGP